MQNFFTVSVAFAAVISSFGTTSSTLIYTAQPQPAVIVRPWSEDDTKDLIKEKAKEYGVSADVMLDVVKCETGNDIASTTIQSRVVKNGVREESYGIVQINLPHNSDITYEQATDPHFAIDFLAKRLSEKKGYLWTCHTMHYGV